MPHYFPVSDHRCNHARVSVSKVRSWSLSLPRLDSQFATVCGLTPSRSANWERVIPNCLRNRATAAPVGVKVRFLEVAVALPALDFLLPDVVFLLVDFPLFARRAVFRGGVFLFFAGGVMPSISIPNIFERSWFASRRRFPCPVVAVCMSSSAEMSAS